MLRLRPFARFAPLVTGVALGLGAVVFLSGLTCGSGAAESPALVAATEDEALAAFVQSRGETFAGACEQTRSPQDIGKVCARFVAERDGTRAYLIGRTFSEFSTWVFLTRTADGWNVAGSTPLNFHDTSMTIPWP